MIGYIEVPLHDGVYRHHPEANIDQAAEIGRDSIVEIARIDQAIIGERVEIGDFTTIMDGAVIGYDCNIRRNVVINNGVFIGSLVKVQNQVSIPPGVTVQSCAFIGPGAKFPNDRHPRSFIPWQPGPETVVRFGASIGANATVVCAERRRLIVGEFSLLAAGSTATKSLRPFGLYTGNEQQGWVNVMGETVSRDPATTPTDAELLRGLSIIPPELRPSQQALNEILHYAQAGL